MRGRGPRRRRGGRRRTRGIWTARRAVRRADRPPPRPAGCAAWRRVPTAAARSVTRPRSAGVFGLKPQRARIPRDVPAGGGGLARVSSFTARSPVTSPTPRSLDATSDDAPGGFSRALSEPVRRCGWRSRSILLRGRSSASASQRRLAVERMAELLTSLGHHVFERELRYGRQTMPDMTVRYLAGVSDDVAELPHPELLEHAHATSGPARTTDPDTDRCRRSPRARRTIAAMINEIFDHADVVLTPIAADAPPLLHELPQLTVSALAARVEPRRVGDAVEPDRPTRRHRPVGLDPAGLPLAVQLCAVPTTKHPPAPRAPDRTSAATADHHRRPPSRGADGDMSS